MIVKERLFACRIGNNLFLGVVHGEIDIGLFRYHLDLAIQCFADIHQLDFQIIAEESAVFPVQQNLKCTFVDGNGFVDPVLFDVRCVKRDGQLVAFCADKRIYKIIIIVFPGGLCGR